MFSVTALNKKYLPGILLLSACVLRIPCDDARLGMEFLFQAAASIGLTVILWKRGNPWVALFLLASFWAMIYPVYDRSSYLAYQAILYGSLWFVFITYYVSNKNLPWILNAICLICLANIAMLCLQHMDMDPIFKPKWGTHDMTVGLMANQNEASAMLAFCFPAFFRRRWCWFIPVVIIGMFLPGCKGGIVTAAVSVAVWGICSGYAIYAIITSFASVFVYFWLTPPEIGYRILAWDKGLHLYKQHWIFGSGIGHWKLIFSSPQHIIHKWWFADEHRYVPVIWKQAHNEFIQALFEMGIPFVVVISGYIQNAVRRWKKLPILTMAVVAVITNSCFNFPFHIGSTAIVAITWLGLLELGLAGEISI